MTGTRILGVIGAITLAITISTPSHAAKVTSYHIGNSYTWDSGPSGLPETAQAVGVEHASGWHIIGSTTLPRIWEVPDGGDWDDVYGTHTDALPNHVWTAVTLQLYPKQEQATLQTDAQAVRNFIDLTRSNPANHDTRFFIYQAWPGAGPGSTIDYSDYWLTQVPNVPEQRMRYHRSYFSHIIENLRAAQPDDEPPVLIIPVGEVLYELDQLIKAGRFPWVASISELYRDEYHMSYGGGRTIAHWTTFTTLHGISPVGLPYDGTNPILLDDAARRRVQQVIWSTVTSLPHSGVLPESGTAVGLTLLSAVLVVAGGRGRLRAR